MLCGGLTAIIGLLGTIAGLVNFPKNYGKFIVIIYVILVILLYIVGLIINNYRLHKLNQKMTADIETLTKSNANLNMLYNNIKKDLSTSSNELKIKNSELDLTNQTIKFFISELFNTTKDKESISLVLSRLMCFPGINQELIKITHRILDEQIKNTKQLTEVREHDKRKRAENHTDNI